MNRSISCASAFIVMAIICSPCAADDAESQKLRARIEQLESQLVVTDEALTMLEKECEKLRGEIRAMKGEKEVKTSDVADPFALGVVWVGEAKIKGQVGKWAISVQERDGNKLSGVIAVVGPGGGKQEIPVSGVAPSSGDGLLTLESPLIGRAKTFMRGHLNNGEVALAVSVTNRLGEKAFGAATLRPAN
jgi:hypothetical protein